MTAGLPREADLVFRIRPFEEAEVIQRKLVHVDYALYAAPSIARPRAGEPLSYVVGEISERT